MSTLRLGTVRAAMAGAVCPTAPAARPRLLMGVWLVLLASLAGCSPALDWREVRVEDREAVLLLPCKPAAHARQVRLGEGPVKLTLQACQAAGMTWGVASADVGDPGRVAAALEALRASSAGNLGSQPGASLPLQVAGATPQPGSGRAAYVGRRPDGQPLQAQVAVFSRGTVVYQATVLGERLSAEAAETFFGSLKLGGGGRGG